MSEAVSELPQAPRRGPGTLPESRNVDRSPRVECSCHVAYLTSAYARASDSFIRGEVTQLRAMGHTVETFSVRKSPASELVSEEIRREHANTEFLLERHTPARLPLAAIKEMVRSPGRIFAA